MKHLFFTFAFAISAFFAQAQITPEFEFLPDSVFLQPLPTSLDTPADLHIHSLVNTDIVIKWQRYVSMLTQGCATKVCDINACYGEQTSTKQFTMPAGDTALISVHFVNNTGQHGQGLVRLDMWNIEYPDVIIPAYYFFNIGQTSGTSDALKLQEIAVFPNPTADFFTVKNEKIARIKMMDGNAREITSWDAPGGGTFEVGAHPTGMYVLLMEDGNGKPVGVAQLNKL